MYSKSYFLIRPVKDMLLPFDENRRYQNGSALIASIYKTSSKPPKIRVANHARFLSQNCNQLYIDQFLFKKSILKSHSWQKHGKIPWKIENLSFFLFKFDDWDINCLDLLSWKIYYFCLVFMVLFAIPIR